MGESLNFPATVSSVGVIVYRVVAHQIQYLLLKKSGDVWEPPKGRIDPGEQPFDAAMRETREEAALTAEQLHLHVDFPSVYVYYQRINGDPKVSRFWLARTSCESIIHISHEHEEFKWCDIDEVLRLIRPGFGEGLKTADSYLRKILNDVSS